MALFDEDATTPISGGKREGYGLKRLPCAFMMFRDRVSGESGVSLMIKESRIFSTFLFTLISFSSAVIIGSEAAAISFNLDFLNVFTSLVFIL